MVEQERIAKRRREVHCHKEHLQNEKKNRAMPRYYVNNNAQSNGDHEVHKEGCFYLQFVQSKNDLGYHNICHTAVAEAKKAYATADGCKTCSEECHNR